MFPRPVVYNIFPGGNFIFLNGLISLYLINKIFLFPSDYLLGSSQLGIIIQRGTYICICIRCFRKDTQKLGSREGGKLTKGYIMKTSFECLIMCIYDFKYAYICIYDFKSCAYVFQFLKKSHLVNYEWQRLLGPSQIVSSMQGDTETCSLLSHD